MLMRYKDYIDTHCQEDNPIDEGTEKIMSSAIGDDTSSVYVLMLSNKIQNQHEYCRNECVTKFLDDIFGEDEGSWGITYYYDYGLAIIFDDREESEKYEQDKQRKHKKFLYWRY